GHVSYPRRPVILDGGYALFAADDTLLFGKLIATNEPLNYHNAFAANLPQRCRKQLVPIPRQFAALLQRLMSISDVGSEPHTEITISHGVATFRLNTRRGEITETLNVPGHPDAKLRVMMSSVHQAYAAALAPATILFTERCVILASGDHLRLVAANVRRV